MASRLSRFKVMSLTDAAASRVKDIIANTDKPIAGLRVGVKNGAAPACPTPWSSPRASRRSMRSSRKRASRC